MPRRRWCMEQPIGLERSHDVDGCGEASGIRDVAACSGDDVWLNGGDINELGNPNHHDLKRWRTKSDLGIEERSNPKDVPDALRRSDVTNAPTIGVLIYTSFHHGFHFLIVRNRCLLMNLHVVQFQNVYELIRFTYPQFAQTFQDFSGWFFCHRLWNFVPYCTESLNIIVMKSNGS